MSGSTRATAPGGLEVLLAHGSLLAADGALRHRDDGEALALAGALLDGSRNGTRVIGNLGDDDNVRAGGNARMQCQPACLMSHDLHDKHAAVRERRGMDGIDDLHGDVHGRLEAERHLRAPEVVVDGLRQRHNGNAVLRKQVCRLVRVRCRQG